MKSTRRPLVGGGQRSGVGRSTEDFFCLFVKSPLWPQGTSARLIPGLPGAKGKEEGGVKG